MRTVLCLSVATLALAACRTTPEPEVPVVEVDPIETCVPLASVEAVTIPAETETFTAITEIDNPPYEPIVRREPMTRTVREAYVVYRRPDGVEVPKSSICEFEAPAPVTPATDGVPVMDGVGARDLTRN